MVIVASAVKMHSVAHVCAFCLDILDFFTYTMYWVHTFTTFCPLCPWKQLKHMHNSIRWPQNFYLSRGVNFHEIFIRTSVEVVTITNLSAGIDAQDSWTLVSYAGTCMCVWYFATPLKEVLQLLWLCPKCTITYTCSSTLVLPVFRFRNMAFNFICSSVISLSCFKYLHNCVDVLVNISFMYIYMSEKSWHYTGR